MSEGQGGEGGANGGGDFLTSLPAEMQSLGTLKGFGGADGHVRLAKSYDEASRALSSRNMADMDAPADDAGRNAVLAKLGHAPPGSPDGYKLGDSSTAQKIATLAHELGMTIKQAETWVAKQTAAETQSATDRTAREESRKTEYEQALRQEWGEQYDANMEQANRAVEHFLPKEERDFLLETGLIHNLPGLQKFLSTAGRALQEGTLHTGSNMTSGPTDKAGFHAERVAVEAKMAEAKKQPGFDPINASFLQLGRERAALLRQEGEHHIADQAKTGG